MTLEVEVEWALTSLARFHTEEGGCRAEGDQGAAGGGDEALGQ